MRQIRVSRRRVGQSSEEVSTSSGPHRTVHTILSHTAQRRVLIGGHSANEHHYARPGPNIAGPGSDAGTIRSRLGFDSGTCQPWPPDTAFVAVPARWADPHWGQGGVEPSRSVLHVPPAQKVHPKYRAFPLPALCFTGIRTALWFGATPVMAVHHLPASRPS